MVKKRAPQVPARTGPRGPRGKPGPVGPKGERGEKGDQGPPRENGVAERLESARAVIAELQKAVEYLRAESDTQLRRIADLQAQLDITLGEFHRLQEPAEKGGQHFLRKRN